MLRNMLVAFALMVLVLYGAAALGGVGSVEITLWVVLTLAVLVAVAWRARRAHA